MRRAVLLIALATLLAPPIVVIAAELPTLNSTRDSSIIALHQSSPCLITTFGQVDPRTTFQSQSAPPPTVSTGFYCPGCNSWLGLQPVVQCPYCGAPIDRRSGPAPQG